MQPLNSSEAGTEQLTGLNSLRPSKLGEYIGQRKVVDNLTVFLRAASRRQESLDHVLLFGPPGLGKTTLASIIAHEMQAELKTVSGPAVQRAGDLAAILTNLKEGDVLFIDEIHRLNPAIEEILYPAMEDFQLDLIIGQGPSARTVKIELPRFTLVGATTRASLITAPLRGRFGILSHLDFYPLSELEAILARSAQLLEIEIEPAAITELARRARGTPRIANMLIRRVRDFAQVIGNGLITETLAVEALNRMEVDTFGLNELDRKILLTIIEKFDGGPVGVGTIAAATAEDKGAIEDLYEPYLIQRGLLNRTPRGRMVTPAAYEHLGIKPPVRDAA